MLQNPIELLQNPVELLQNLVELLQNPVELNWIFLLFFCKEIQIYLYFFCKKVNIFCLLGSIYFFGNDLDLSSFTWGHEKAVSRVPGGRLKPFSKVVEKQQFATAA